MDERAPAHRISVVGRPRRDVLLRRPRLEVQPDFARPDTLLGFPETRLVLRTPRLALAVELLACVGIRVVRFRLREYILGAQRDLSLMLILTTYPTHCSIHFTNARYVINLWRLPI